jgi:hypothetical protein
MPAHKVAALASCYPKAEVHVLVHAQHLQASRPMRLV